MRSCFRRVSEGLFVLLLYGMLRPSSRSTDDDRELLAAPRDVYSGAYAISLVR